MSNAKTELAPLRYAFLMCANYVPVTSLDRLLQYFGVVRDRDEPEHDLFPMGLAPFIRLAAKGEEAGPPPRFVGDAIFRFVPEFVQKVEWARRTYNARRDNLEGFWKGQFGHTHGLMVVNAFYEHVAIPKKSATGTTVDDEAAKVILEFKPRPTQDMLVACLWSRWTGAGEPDLLSFAAITDEPPPEVAAAGHDRCIIPIKPEHVDAWLNPDSANLKALYVILDDRQRPYYEHRLAA